MGQFSMQPMIREYFYELTDRGVLLLDGVEQDDPWFLDFFFRRIAPSANPLYPEYPWVSRCGDEMNYVRAADTPIVFTRLHDMDLGYAAGLTVRFDAAALAYSADGVLYHNAPVAGVGRIAPSIAVELARYIEPWGPIYAFADPFTSIRTPIRPLQEARYEIIRPRIDNHCIGCGEANPHSFKLSFLHDKVDDRVRTWITPDARMHGSLDTVHGGFVSLLLDETMGKSLSYRRIKAPTARLTVNFRRPMRVGRPYMLVSWIDTINGRKNMLRGEVRDAVDDTLIADADALFITITPPSAA